MLSSSSGLETLTVEKRRRRREERMERRTRASERLIINVGDHDCIWEGLEFRLISTFYRSI